MKTLVPKKKEIIQGWYHIDAEGKVLGKVATRIADLLRGKLKTNFTAHLDCGDFVVVTNVEKIALTGKKEVQKMYYKHSGFPGGLKEINAGELRRTGKADRILLEAVRGMLPHNKLRDDLMKKLKIFLGPEHTHQAQKPETITIR